MLAPIIAVVLAIVAALCLGASALLGVTTLADWTIDAAQVLLLLAIVVFYGYFFTACINEFRKA